MKERMILIVICISMIILITFGQDPITFFDLDVTLRNELLPIFTANNGATIASVVRLAFHDCAGQQEDNLDGSGPISICDGCIDFSNPDHSGLEDLAINIIDPIYENNWSDRMSRADFYAASATIALQIAKDNDNININDILPPIPFKIGRKDCSLSPDIDITRYSTPYKKFPNAVGGCDENVEWFENNFEFNTRDVVSIMGAHTLGRLHPQFSGFGTGNNGSPWAPNEDSLDNSYYIELVNRNWRQQRVDNVDKDLFEWRRQSRGVRVMLNSDVCLLRDIDDDFINIENGELSCTNSLHDCFSLNDDPNNNNPASLVTLYANNNQQWLNDFGSAWNKMITMGYQQNELITLSDNTVLPTDSPIINPPVNVNNDNVNNDNVNNVIVNNNPGPKRGGRGGRGRRGRGN